jgi:hypothetical protein
MPEFILDHGTPEASQQFASLDSFTQGYIEAMFFTEEERLCEESDEWEMPDVGINRATMKAQYIGGDTPTFADLAPATIERIKADCEAFQAAHAALLESVYGVTGRHERNAYDESRAGNDYWYTRNGHGTGFWDRGLGEAGDKLATAARYSERNLYRGDDGLLYLD